MHAVHYICEPSHSYCAAYNTNTCPHIVRVRSNKHVCVGWSCSRVGGKINRLKEKPNTHVRSTDTTWNPLKQHAHGWYGKSPARRTRTDVTSPSWRHYYRKFRVETVIKLRVFFQCEDVACLCLRAYPEINNRMLCVKRWPRDLTDCLVIPDPFFFSNHTFTSRPFYLVLRECVQCKR